LRYLHEKLTTLREGIAGSAPRKRSWLLKEIREISEIAATDDPVISKELLKIEEGIINMSDDDMRKRIEIDQIACKILNDQEDRIRR